MIVLTFHWLLQPKENFCIEDDGKFCLEDIKIIVVLHLFLMEFWMILGKKMDTNYMDYNIFVLFLNKFIGKNDKSNNQIV